ncbi:MAG: GGDEF domain-containing protein [Armatimonadetes bacterium]|nr:GGDEF domain-containing protein [Armatimonadota bacterium]
MFRRSRPTEATPDPSTAPAGQPAEAPSRAAALDADAECIKDTLAKLVQRFGANSLPTAETRGQGLAARCEQLALELLTRRPPTPDQPPRPTAHVCRDIAAVFDQQRGAETKEYRAHQIATQALLQGLVNSLVEADSRQGHREFQALDALNGIQSALSTGDLKQVREQTDKATGAIRDMISARHEDAQQRIEHLGSQLQRMRDELAEAEAQGQRDAMTGLLNRGRFDQAIAHAVALTQASNGKLALFMLDIDHFKSINDTYGHPVGDDVIKAVARTLERSFPRQDDIVARYGGEEFCVACQQVDADVAVMLGERARKAVGELVVDSGRGGISPTISVGYALLTDQDTPESLIARADSALYQAKQGGRNRVCAAL